MIGQKELQSRFRTLVEDNSLPRFIMLVGEYGSGRSTIAKSIASMMSCYIFDIDIGVDSIRDMIEQSYKLSMPCIYVMHDCDGMSLQAKNALLKVTEEPPNNAYFIMTVQDINNMLDTIKSRASIFNIEPYSFDELKAFIPMDITDVDVYDVCTTPHEVKLITDYGAKDFSDFVQLVVNNIDFVSGVNAFKIGNRLALNGADGYDIKLFWRAFNKECFERRAEKYLIGVNITTRYLNQLRSNTISKANLFDMWLLEIRDRWFDYAEC